MSSTLTRRHLLRGAGVALALPWLESLAPRAARGQTPAAPRRFVPVYFPLGTATLWTPKGVGSGNAWQLSPILAPLAPLKAQVTVLGHVDNTAYALVSGRPYPRETGSFLTCVPASGTPAQNGISVDQVIADQLAAANGGKSPTALPSLQLGLSTLDSFTEDLPPAFSRSISWRSPTEPLGKLIDPQAVFDKIIAASSPSQVGVDAAMLELQATRKSILDLVADHAATIQPRLSVSDRRRLDQFTTSVRDVERRLVAAPAPQVLRCSPLTRPAQAIAVNDVPAGYDRDAHANLMIDLMVMALSCDATRVISLMLDDARSDYVYSFLTQRNFSDTGSTVGTGGVGGYFGQTNAGASNNGYATINFWFVSKLAALCQKLAAVPDSDGRSVLDNSVVWFGSGMHGANHAFTDLPLLYVGGGGGVLRQGFHLDFAPGRRLSDVYFTFLQKVFGASSLTSFADSQGVITDLLA